MEFIAAVHRPTAAGDQGTVTLLAGRLERWSIMLRELTIAMNRLTRPLVVALSLSAVLPSLMAQEDASAGEREAALISGLRQLTFEGRRAGEGYYSRDGRSMVFQSEREPGNPFYQIYLLDLETGDIERVSPGHGKTTCAWIHSDNDRVVYASTHTDERARDKQQEELDLRASGTERRYAWDYDETFELFAWSRRSRSNTRLTFAPGYDAEGSYSPDGEWVCFASNRAAYLEPLSDEDAKRFEVDKSLFMDLYLMRSDGSDVRRLTFARGYDGGPFFSHDGARICWRRFSENGLTAEIWTMNVDGSDKRQLTQIGAMSWAPFFHPSGEYLIFTTNRHGFGNFELYLVDARGEREPVRVSFTDGFDGLPTFTPDGRGISWTSTRTGDGSSQIFVGQWDHAAARALLERSPSRGRGQEPRVETTVAAVRVEDLRRHAETLCTEEMNGRLTGSPGERNATGYVAGCFKSYGLEPGGDDGTWFQLFRARLLGDNRKLINAEGRNVIGVLRGPSDGAEPPLVIGAHIDHLGERGGSYSLADKDSKAKLHPGADDNASGVAGLLEVAESLAAAVRDGKLTLSRDVVFAAWSGEEAGLFGSKHYVKELMASLGVESLRGKVSAYLNMDMIGRLRESLILSGIGSSSVWRGVIERRNAPVGLSLSLVEDVRLPTDTSAFYPHGVPILNAFTGAHTDYHRPSDTIDKLNFEGMEKTARLMALIARGLAQSADEPDYVEVKQEQASADRQRTGGRPYLGTIPDYAGEGEGVLLDGAAEGGPAWKAGVRGGDRIVELGGEKVGDIYDYTDVLETLKPDVKVKIVVLRAGKRLTFDLVPGRRG